jgi:hypothetical protein
MKLPAIVNEKLLTRAMLGVGVYFAIVKPLLIKFNIQDSKAEKAEKIRLEAAKVTSNSGGSDSPYSWAAFFASAPAKPLILDNASAVRFAKILHDAYNYWNFMNQYDQDKAFGVLSALKTQSQFAWVAKKFFEMYSTSLHSYLSEDTLTKDEFADFNLKLVQKPKYKA